MTSRDLGAAGAVTRFVEGARSSWFFLKLESWEPAPHRASTYGPKAAPCFGDCACGPGQDPDHRYQPLRAQTRRHGRRSTPPKPCTRAEFLSDTKPFGWTADHFTIKYRFDS